MKWGICLLLFAATTLNYLDRQTLANLAPRIQREMNLDNEQLGLLFTVFYYSYTFAQFAVGPLLDRFSLRWLFGGAVVLWSIVAAATGTASGFVALIVFRLLLGITESANWPGAMRIVARLLPPEQRAMGNGLFTSGTSIGALIAPALILGLASRFGWRITFAAVGALGFVWFGLWWFFTRSPKLADVWRGPRPGPALAGYAEVLRTPQFWKVFCVTIMVNPCLYFYLNWLATYFSQQHGFSESQLVPVLTGVYIGLDLGYLASGGAVFVLRKIGLELSSARRIVFTAATALLICSSIAAHETFVALIIPMLVVSNFAIGAWIAMYLTLAQEVSDVHVSTASGLLGGLGSLAGGFAMSLVGTITKQTGSFAIPFTAVTVFGVIAMLAAWTATPREYTEQKP